jgi:hypothetical protein
MYLIQPDQDLQGLAEQIRLSANDFTSKQGIWIWKEPILSLPQVVELLKLYNSQQVCFRIISQKRIQPLYLVY